MPTTATRALRSSGPFQQLRRQRRLPCAAARSDHIDLYSNFRHLGSRGEYQQIAVRQFFRLVMQSCRVDSDRTFDRTPRTMRGIPAADRIAEHVNFKRLKVPAMENQVAVLQSIDTLNKAVCNVVPDNFVVRVERDNDSPA